MVRSALGNISVTDAMAILKRSAVIVFSEKFIYYRLPSQQLVSVQRIRWSKLDVLKDSCKPVLKNFFAGGPAPASFHNSTVWEQEARLCCSLPAFISPCDYGKRKTLVVFLSLIS